jgi:hypothetical protein
LKFDRKRVLGYILIGKRGYRLHKIPRASPGHVDLAKALGAFTENGLSIIIIIDPSKLGEKYLPEKGKNL